MIRLTGVPGVMFYSSKNESAFSVAQSKGHSAILELFKDPKQFALLKNQYRFLSLINKRLKVIVDKRSNKRYLNYLFSEIEKLLKNKTNVDTRYTNDWHALHYAARDNDLELVNLLLKYNADVNYVVTTDKNAFRNPALASVTASANCPRTFIRPSISCLPRPAASMAETTCLRNSG